MNIIGFINDFNASYDKHINLLKYESVKQISESIDHFINDQLIDGETFNLPKFKKTNSKFKIKDYLISIINQYESENKTIEWNYESLCNEEYTFERAEKKTLWFRKYQK